MYAESPIQFWRGSECTSWEQFLREARLKNPAERCIIVLQRRGLVREWEVSAKTTRLTAIAVFDFGQLLTSEQLPPTLD